MWHLSATLKATATDSSNANTHYAKQACWPKQKYLCTFMIFIIFLKYFIVNCTHVCELGETTFYYPKRKTNKKRVPTFQGFSIHTNEAIKAHCKNQTAQLYQLFRNYCIHLNKALKAHVVNVGHRKVWFSSWAE